MMRRLPDMPNGHPSRGGFNGPPMRGRGGFHPFFRGNSMRGRGGFHPNSRPNPVAPNHYNHYQQHGPNQSQQPAPAQQQQSDGKLQVYILALLSIVMEFNTI